MLYILLCPSCDVACGRNAATETVQQELLFVGQEAGKLMAMRDIIKKVCSYVCVCVRTVHSYIRAQVVNFAIMDVCTYIRTYMHTVSTGFITVEVNMCIYTVHPCILTYG